MENISLLNFKKALPIYPLEYLKEMNISLFFVAEIDVKTEAEIAITGNSIFRLFDNGKLIGYGPSRAAHEYYRIDCYQLNKGHHKLVIELSGYNCNTYYVLNTPPFLQCEVIEEGNIVLFTGDNNHFKCFFNETRIQKVTRFAYQRAFSESYKSNVDFQQLIKGNIDFTPLKCSVFDNYKYLSKNVDYQKFMTIPFKRIEEGKVIIDNTLNKYEDRYMYFDYLGIFPKDTWEVNPNDEVSLYRYQKESISSKLSDLTFFTYALENSKTGFLEYEIDVEEDAEIYFIFDEIDTSDDPSIIDIKFYRNTTHNIISYNLKKGHYEHISFEPYTIKYMRLIVKKGQISVKKVNFILYENPLNTSFKYSFNDQRIQSIFKAGEATLLQNAVDVLTDCPSRERAGWLCDSYFSAKAENLIFGSNKVEHNFLENYALAKQYPTLPKGMIPMCYPGEYPDGNFIPNWSMFYILELEDYLYRTNDTKLIKQSLIKVQGILDYFATLENELGLLEDLKGWIFVEWSKANDEDFVRGVNFPSNMLYSETLIAASRLLKDENLFQKAQKIKEKIKEYSFDGQFFHDNMIREGGHFKLTSNITETCQYYAFYFKIADKENYQELYNTLITDFGPRRDIKSTYPNVAPSNVFIGDYLRLMILCNDERYLQVKEESVDYFYNMAKITGTLWEHDSTFASLNHALTSYILNILVEACFGFVTIDRLHKIIYFKELDKYEDGEIVIPIDSEHSLEIIAENNKLKITHMGEYEVEFLK